MRILFLITFSALILGLTRCGTDSNNDVITNEPGMLIWDGAPEVDGTGLLFETADTTYGAPGSYEDYDSYFPENEFAVEVIADYLITGETTTRGWGVQFPEIRLIDIEVPE